MIRVGIVGCGFIGNVHSVALAQIARTGLADAAVVATHYVDAARAEATARHHDGAMALPTVDALLDAVDAVWVCTWTGGHREVVEAAASHGTPVFCEKPLAPTLAECEAVASALRAVPHQVGLVLAHAPVFRAMAEAVRSGRYGAPLAAVFRDDQYFPIQGMYGSTWRADVARAGGGTLVEHSIHDVDVLRRILGDARDVSARTACHFGHAGIEDVANVSLTYADGATAALVSVWHQVTSRPSTRRVEVFCEDALLWTEDDHLGPLHVQTSDRDETVTADPPPWTERLGMPDELAVPLAQYVEPSLAFLAALGRAGVDARGHPDVDDALAAHRIVDAAYRSAAAGGVPVATEATPAR